MGRRVSGSRDMLPGLGAAIRAAVVDRMRLLYGSFPSGPKRLVEIAAIESGAPVQLDTVTLGNALSNIDQRLARQFNFRSDPDSSRRFLLTEDNELTELEPSERGTR